MSLFHYVIGYFVNKYRIEEIKLIKKRIAKVGKGAEIMYPIIVGEPQNIEIGNNTTILSGARLQVFNGMTKKQSKILIGDNCYIGFNFSVLAGGSVVIGNNVLIASNVLITSENHMHNPEDEEAYMSQKLICKNVSIGNNTWIGQAAMIMPGTEIGSYCVIGSGAVVTKSIPNYSIAVGNPAKVIKKYDFEKHNWI